MSGRLLVLVPDEAVQRIRAGGNWGRVTYQASDPDGVGAVIAVSNGSDPVMPTPLSPASHFLRSGDPRSGHRWYRVDADLHACWWRMRRVDGALPVDAFRSAVQSGWQNPSSSGAYVAVTHSLEARAKFPDVGVPEIAAWWISESGVTAVDIEVQTAGYGISQLLAHWPVEKLFDLTVVVVGLGSIGGATAHALASYGVGRLVLLDPDRLLSHNVVRHVGSSRFVGKRKVDVVKEQLNEGWPDTVVEALPLNVIADADQVRPILRRARLVLCAADGVAPRRVVSHLARRAKVDALMACVLQDGVTGELLRLRPWPGHGCLTCRREALVESGAMDPEPALDLGYGTGTTHRPMTAVGGDLHLLGQLAAKVAVATVLERCGVSGQTLPGEHALIGLQPQFGWAPPFDIHRSTEIRWLPHTPPRAGCPTCEAA